MGTVTTATRSLVSGLQVDIYLNTEKTAEGGILAGTGFVTDGIFIVRITVPPDLPARAYQVIAHTKGDSRFKESWSDPDVEVYSGTHVRLIGPSVALVGEPVHLRGQLLQESGVPIARGAVEVTVDGQTSLLVAGDDGTFDLPHTFDVPGTHLVAARFTGTPFLLEQAAELHIQVLAGVNLTLVLPRQVETGPAVEVRGSLRDTDGAPISNAPVRLQVASLLAEESLVLTDADGGFSWRGAFVPGFHQVRASFDGSEVLASAEASAEVVALLPARLSIIVPAEIAVGQQIEVRLRLADAKGMPLPAKEVEVSIAGAASLALTDDQGMITLRREIAAPGTHTVWAAAAPSGFLTGAASEREVLARIPTRLTVTVPEKATRGKPIEVTASLQDDQGRPVEGARLTASPAGDEVTTDAAGQARFLLAVPQGPGAEAFPVRIEFSGDSLHAPATAVASVPLARAFGLWPAGGIALAGLAGFGIGCGLVLALRRRPTAARATRAPGGTTSDVMGQEASLAAGQDSVTREGEGESENAEPPPPPLRATSMTLALPQLAPALPPVWGIGDLLAAICDLRDADARNVLGASIRLDAGDQAPAWLTTGDDGRCATEVAFEAKGTVIITCTFEGTEELLPCQASTQVRIVDYREEVVGLFNSYLAPFRNGSGGVPKDATPREAEVALVSRLLVRDERALDTLITVFEEANYSLHPIGRKQYERAYGAYRHLHRGGPAS